MINCNNCDKELDRCVFCSDKCRKQYVRKADKKNVVLDNSVRKADKLDDFVRKADAHKSRRWNCKHGKSKGNCSLCK